MLRDEQLVDLARLAERELAAADQTRVEVEVELQRVSIDVERAAHPFQTSSTFAPISLGAFTTWMPAASSAAIFSAAVPLPPLMMAPAWPMRRPGGAVWPAMKATTGFVTFAFTNAAASSSADAADLADHDDRLGRRVAPGTRPGSR